MAGLPEKPWVKKNHLEILDRSLPFRMAWQCWSLPALLHEAGCNVLLSPGGILPHKAELPTVVISQNLLPFQLSEMRRFPPLSFMRLKMHLVRWAQIRSMQKATGLIFLSSFAKSTVLSQLENHSKLVAIIPHGVEKRYFREPRPSDPASFSFSKPFHFLYVSRIDVYKHQWRIALAVASLRQKGYPITLDLVGSGYTPALRRLKRIIHKIDPGEGFIRYLGPSPFEEMHRIYHRADGLVFASSCENLPNILLEGMASGLPIACSDSGPMPEVLGTAGVYFSLNDPATIETALQRLLVDHELRRRVATEAYDRSKNYSWQKCSNQTFSFVSKISKLGMESQ